MSAAPSSPRPGSPATTVRVGSFSRFCVPLRRRTSVTAERCRGPAGGRDEAAKSPLGSFSNLHNQAIDNIDLYNEICASARPLPLAQRNPPSFAIVDIAPTPKMRPEMRPEMRIDRAPNGSARYPCGTSGSHWVRFSNFSRKVSAGPAQTILCCRHRSATSPLPPLCNTARTLTRILRIGRGTKRRTGRAAAGPARLGAPYRTRPIAFISAARLVAGR
jgi:hypothetical protein